MTRPARVEWIDSGERLMEGAGELQETTAAKKRTSQSLKRYQRQEPAPPLGRRAQPFRKKRDRLLAGIATRTDSSRLYRPATAVTSSRCRMPQAGSPRLRL